MKLRCNVLGELNIGVQEVFILKSPIMLSVGMILEHNDGLYEVFSVGKLEFNSDGELDTVDLTLKKINF